MIMNHEILIRIPNLECLRKFKRDFPELNYYGMLIDNQTIELIKDALDKSYDQLHEIREKGLTTHAEGHAMAFLFRKILDLYELQFIHFSPEFKKMVNNNISRLNNSFSSIFTILTSNFESIDNELKFVHILSKNDKNLLLRAFWNDFQSKYDDFCHQDFLEKYAVIWNDEYNRFRVHEHQKKIIEKAIIEKNAENDNSLKDD